MSGASTQFIDVEEASSSQSQHSLDLVWATLLSAREAAFLMGCSCGAGKRVPDAAEFQRVGLMSRHAYSILDVRQIDDQRFSLFVWFFCLPFFFLFFFLLHGGSGGCAARKGIRNKFERNDQKFGLRLRASTFAAPDICRLRLGLG